MSIREGQQNVVQAKCCIIDSTGTSCGTTVEIIQNSPKVCWNHLQNFHKTEFLTLKMTQVRMVKGVYVSVLVYVRLVY